MWNLLLAAAVILTAMTGCGDIPSGDTGAADIGEDAACLEEKNNDAEAERIAAVYRDIYDEAAAANTLGSPEVTKRIVERLGAHGYVAVDSQNQVDMVSDGVRAAASLYRRREPGGSLSGAGRYI